MYHGYTTIAQSLIICISGLRFWVFMSFIINNLANSPSLLQWSGVQVWPNRGPLAVKIPFLQSNPTVHQHTNPLYLLLLICTLYFFPSPFQLLSWLPFLNMFLLPFFVSFPVWPQWEKCKSNSVYQKHYWFTK